MSAFITSPDPNGLRGQGTGILVAEGIILLLLGIGAIVAPLFAGVLAASVIGWLLIVVGIVGLVATVSSRPHVHFWAGLLSSLAALAIGLAIVFSPGAGAIMLSYFVAAWLFFDGISSVMIALNSRRTNSANWWWLIVSAIIDWILAFAIVLSNPVLGIAMVGTLIGIDLIFGGVALLGLSRGLRGRAS